MDVLRRVGVQDLQAGQLTAVLAVALVVTAALAAHYRAQRDDLFDWIADRYELVDEINEHINQ